MDVQTILRELEKLGTEQTRKIFRNHGATGPMYGVKVGDLKALQQRLKLKHEHELSLALYDTGNSDAMYLAGLISAPQQMSKEELHAWAVKANWYMLSEYTVAWTASESRYGRELAMEWMDSAAEQLQAAGWSTYSNLLSITADEQLDMAEIRWLLHRVEREVHGAANRTRYTMNGFVIAAGSFVPALLEEARRVAAKIGVVEVELGGTACKVPLATTYIEKVVDAGRVGKKKKTAFC
ncbi:DNA alkylation repair protein [Chitinophaga pendula]|uniref:DNA alkylation repair protein n=1 Tax=Chitinophaga TaxID=79328 RepID=UPI000BAF635C|nr:MULTISPECIES: DNA alkylation repair protein [Chitinophaga]ASZ14971.1 DNA alkylation repair protein [Chitinophaga sp. MD30]UCJ10047.1 DNA alkylation repair protein [Chitinophaga pendula]